MKKILIGLVVVAAVASALTLATVVSGAAPAHANPKNCTVCCPPDC